MFIRFSELKNLVLNADDGEIGRCRDLLFDDDSWTVRYLEANTSKWLLGRRVLISPAALALADSDGDRLPVRLNKRQIEEAPGIDEDQPISRQYESAYSRHFGYLPYWTGGALWGGGLFPGDIVPPSAAEAAAAAKTEQDAARQEDHQADPHLRSATEVIGYGIHASDGDIGVVDDLIVDSEDWRIIFLGLDTRRWLPGHKLLLPVAWADEISWAEQRLQVDVTKEAIQTAPELEEPISREELATFYSHFGRP